MQSIQRVVMGFVVAAASLLACSGASPVDTPPSAAVQGAPVPAVTDQTVFHQTVVRFNADGTQTVRVIEQTAEEAKAAQLELLHPSVASKDPKEKHTPKHEDTSEATCSGSVGAALYDQTCGNGGNSICFSGKSSNSNDIYLGNYCHTWSGGTCLYTWWGIVAAALANTEDGYITGYTSGSPCSGGCDTAFPPNGMTNCTSLNYSVDGAPYYVTLTN